MLTILKDGNARTTDTEPSTWTLQWTSQTDIADGTEVELRGANLRTLISVRWIDFDGDDDNELIWRVKEQLSFNDIAKHNPKRAIARFRLGRAVAAGQNVCFRVTALVTGIAGGEFPIHLALHEAERGLMLGGPVTLRVAAGRAERLFIWARPGAETDGSVRVLLAPMDGKGYPTAFAAETPVALQVAGATVWEGAVEHPRIAHLSPPPGKEVLRLTARIGQEDLTEGDGINNARKDGKDLLVTSNPVWLQTKDLLPLFGEIHWHTNISGDGMRDIEVALDTARDLLNLDFVAPGDHNPQGPNWERTVAALEAANADGEFATFFGWEASSNQGHENFYFTDPDHPLVCNGSAGFKGGFPADSTPVLDQHEDFIAIPHHTNAISKAVKDDGSHYWYPYPWKEPRSEYRRLVEIFQVRGNQEREHYPDEKLWRVDYSGNGGSVQTALDAGHQFGFTGGTDNHTGWPTFIGRGHGSNIYTGVWAPARERRAVYDALFARHTWACWSTRAIIRFTVNNALQGDELQVPAGTALTANIRMSLEAPLQLLEIVTGNDTVIPVASPDGLDIATSACLGAAGGKTYFYLRALQTDGAIIYASPVFVKIQ